MSIVRWFLYLFGKAHMPTIRLINHSTHVTDAEFLAAAKAQQIQVTRDFAPIWGKPATIKTGKKARAGEWRFVLADTIAVAGALGYHTVRGVTPTAIIDVALCEQDGVSWTSCLSHEVLEALADPFCNLTWPYPGGKHVAYEVGDPVERDGYLIDGVEMSNFVTIAWFKGGPGPYDFLGKLTGPVPHMTPGGYISVHDATGWHQVYGDGTPSARGQHSRRSHDRGAL